MDIDSEILGSNAMVLKLNSVYPNILACSYPFDRNL